MTVGGASKSQWSESWRDGGRATFRPSSTEQGRPTFKNDKEDLVNEIKSLKKAMVDAEKEKEALRVKIHRLEVKGRDKVGREPYANSLPPEVETTHASKPLFFRLHFHLHHHLLFRCPKLTLRARPGQDCVASAARAQLRAPREDPEPHQGVREQLVVGRDRQPQGRGEEEARADRQVHEPIPAWKHVPAILCCGWP
jgi:hypothetical protein